MNFKNRLEALKWMCENIGERVYFDYEILSGIRCWLTGDGIFVGDISPWCSIVGAKNFRTTPDYIPDPKPEPEFEWPRNFTCFPERLEELESIEKNYIKIREAMNKKWIDEYNQLVENLEK